jgi:hypothetical protein
MLIGSGGKLVFCICNSACGALDWEAIVWLMLLAVFCPSTPTCDASRANVLYGGHELRGGY